MLRVKLHYISFQFWNLIVKLNDGVNLGVIKAVWSVSWEMIILRLKWEPKYWEPKYQEPKESL